MVTALVAEKEKPRQKPKPFLKVVRGLVKEMPAVSALTAGGRENES
jgi:hypothetical protein